MKIFLLPFIFLSTIAPAFAQWRLEIYDLEGKLLGDHDYETKEKAEEACKKNCGVGAFGKPERLVALDGATDEDRAQALEVIPANEETHTPSMLRLRQTYSVKISDVTAQRAQEKAMRDGMAKAVQAMECGKQAQAYMLVRNAPKKLSREQVKLLVFTYAPVKDLLDTGSLESASEEISEIEADGVIVTNEDKKAIVTFINGCKP